MARIQLSNASDAKPCVVAGDALRELGFGERQIDLLSVDIEGHEADILRCLDFDRHKPSAVLVETNKMDLRATDRFFHRKGYVNRETFSGSEPVSPQRWRAQWMDNLYVPAPGPPTVYPGSPNCSDPSDKLYRKYWCQPFHHWSPYAHATQNAPGQCVGDLGL